MRATTGGNMFMYRNSGTNGTPVWNLVASVEDVAISDFSRAMAEIKIRSSQWTKNLAALIQTVKVEFKHYYGVDSTNFAAMLSCFLNGIAEEWAIMDAPITITGAQGLRCAFLVSDFPFNQPIEEASNLDVGLSTAYYESPVGTIVEPSWYTVAGASTSTTSTLP